ncbi:MAG: tetraacyldisaccharide 4'-kinase [Betaproteobacteria bacterium]
MMDAWFLREWQHNSPWQILLRPLSWLFAVLVLLRRALYRTGILKSERVRVPVIVVGNVTVGGTGKTPLVLEIAQSLGRAGWHCGILSRGYSRGGAGRELRRQMAAVIQVAPAAADPAVIGDEALLLANRSGVPVYISADRVAAARTLLKDHPAIDVLICDDGLQHYSLRRDLEICVIDVARGFGNGALLPAGPLREPVTRLRQVDAIVINAGSALAAQDLASAAAGVPAFPMKLANESLVRVRDGRIMSIDAGLAEFSAKRMLAIAGTGNPARFFEHLASLGFKAAGTVAFPDHHPFAAGDFLSRDADIFLMTEKDAVKCQAFADDRMWFMRVDAILPATFGEFIANRLSKLKK